MSNPNDPTDPNIQRTPDYPPQPEYYAQAPGYPTYAQGYPPTPPAQPQQPYPPYQPYPGQYAPPPMPQKQSNRTLWIVLGSVGAALVLICGVCAFAVIALGGQIGKALSPTIGASVTLANFCAAMQNQDYSQAYAQFSTSLQEQLTEDQFTTIAAGQDTASGTVTSCSTDSSNSSRTSISDTQATLPVRIERSTGLAITGDVTMVKEGGTFKIDRLDLSFNLT
jgi:hypothetical protein